MPRRVRPPFFNHRHRICLRGGRLRANIMNVLISAIRNSGTAISIFELHTADGKALPAYQPGAHIDVTLGNGLVRQYSLCCDHPSPDRYRIAVKQEPQSRGGSAWLHAEAKEGDALQISAPRNAFSLAEAAGSHLLFAGGIGITPMLSMAYALLRDGADFHLHYFVRDDQSVAFRDELTGTSLAEHVSIHAGLSVDQTGAVIAAALTDGKEIDVASGKTALACLQEAGIDVDCSCEVGVCGTCQTKVIEGIPDHRDGFLSEKEKASNLWFMPCVSRARTGVLVLDL